MHIYFICVNLSLTLFESFIPFPPTPTHMPCLSFWHLLCSSERQLRSLIQQKNSSAKRGIIFCWKVHWAVTWEGMDGRRDKEREDQTTNWTISSVPCNFTPTSSTRITDICHFQAPSWLSEDSEAVSTASKADVWVKFLAFCTWVLLPLFYVTTETASCFPPLTQF